MIFSFLGKAPNGSRKERMAKSPHYKDGKFQNIEETSKLAQGFSMIGELYKTFFQSDACKPTVEIPSDRTDLKALATEKDLLVWFGHSSYYMQLGGKRILVDPVFSGSASPIPGATKAFRGSEIYQPEDMPEIDILLITHDHYDHLDFETITRLKPKVAKVICGLGVGAHFEYWGYEPDIITEKDWNETIMINDRFKIYTATARHGSGRTLDTNNTLWMSYIIEAGDKKVYVGGDSGYGAHFAEIGEKHGGFDLAIIENGQYNEAWHQIHMMPEEVLQAAKDLKAKRFLPVHSCKFVLARHAWSEPLEKITELCAAEDICPITPLIGQTVDLNDLEKPYKSWWVDIE